MALNTRSSSTCHNDIDILSSFSSSELNLKREDELVWVERASMDTATEIAGFDVCRGGSLGFEFVFKLRRP